MSLSYGCAPNEIVATELGVALTFGSFLTWLDVVNDDDADAVWVTLNGGQPTTDSTKGHKLDPGGALSLGSDRIPGSVNRLMFTTETGKLAKCRIAAGLGSRV